MNMRIVVLVSLLILAGSAYATDPKVIDVKVERTPAQKYNISVTIEHKDTGWEHFANAWRVYTPDGELLAERVLHHPHVNEQPFKRALTGVYIPNSVDKVIIKANCSDTKEGKKGYTVNLR